MLSVPLFTNPVKFCLALLIGSAITGVILSLIKKPVTEADENFDDLGSVDVLGMGTSDKELAD